MIKESRLDGTPLRLAPLGPPGPLALLGPPEPPEPPGPLGPLGNMADLVVIDMHLPQESRLVLGVLVFLVFLVFQGHHLLLASQLVPLDQLPLVVQDKPGLPADLAVHEYLVLPAVREYLVLPVVREYLVLPVVREYLVLPVVLPVPGVLGGPLLVVVDAFPAVLGCSKWQAAIEPQE